MSGDVQKQSDFVRFCTFALIALTPALVPVQLLRPEDRLSIKALRAVNVLFTRIYHRLEVQAPNQLPRHGPAILVCNHTSGLDPLLVQAPCNRLITWMMASEYYRMRSIAWIFRAVSAIPVERSGRDSAALRAALRALDNGAVLGIFPEGRISTTSEVLQFQTGVALMAMRTGVPVYPAYLDGTQRGKEMVPAFLLRNRVTLRFGPAVEFDRTLTSRQGIDKATSKIRQAIISLKQSSL